MARTSINVPITGDARPLRGALNDADGALGSFQSGAGSKLLKIGSLIAGAFAAQAVVNFGRELFTLGGQLETLNVKIDTVFGDEAASIRDWADSANEAFGVTDTQLAGMAANMADLLKPMGFTSREAATMSRESLELAGALSAWSGGTRTTAEVSEILSSALLGEYEQLKSLGISINAAEVETRALALAQEEGTDEVNAMHEALAVQRLILEKSTDAQAAWNDGSMDAIKTQNELKARLAEVREEIATRLYPIFVKIGEWIVGSLVPWIESDLVPALRSMWQWFDAHIVPALQDAWSWIKEKLFPALVEFAGWVQDEVVPVLEDMWTTIQNDVIPAVQDFAGWVVDDAVPALQDFWHWAEEKVLDAVTKLATFVDESVVPAVQRMARWVQEDLVPAIKSAWHWIDEELVPAAIRLYKHLEDKLLPGIKAVANVLGVTLVAGAVGFMVAYYNFIKPTFDKFREGAELLLSWLKPIKDTLDAIGASWSVLLTGPIGGLAQGLTGGLGSLLPGGGGGGNKTPKGIPRLAAGGIVTAPTLALIGEAGPEAVVPLSGRNGGGMGNSYTINVQALDATQAGPAVIEAIRSYERRNGAGWRAA